MNNRMESHAIVKKSKDDLARAIKKVKENEVKAKKRQEKILKSQQEAIADAD
jgi:hypothetical protein